MTSPTAKRQFICQLLAFSGVVILASGCDGCGTTEPDAGVRPPVDAGAPLADAGEQDAGHDPDPTPEADAGTDAGSPADAGALDGGSFVEPEDPPFNWQDLFGDAGVPEELECIPGTLPGFSISEILASFELERYQGGSETGVVCGDVTCAEGVPCCELCGYAQCAEPGANGEPPSCPVFVRSIQCDGHEDCPNDPAADTCCYTLEGTECRAEADCSFELPDLGLGDAGFAFPFPAPAPNGGGSGVSDGGTDGGSLSLDAGPADAGAVNDGGVDGGPLDAGGPADAGQPFVDAGQSLVDAGAPPVEIDAGPQEPGPIEAFFDQGVPVCRNTLFDCDPFALEVCCTSPRIVTLDIGMCLPALLCFNEILP